MLNHHPNARFMQFEICTERAGRSHQIGPPLPQCVIQARALRGFARSFWYATMAFCRKHPGIGAPCIRGDTGTLAISGGPCLPELTACVCSAIATGATDAG